jgi:hypothetical protein
LTPIYVKFEQDPEGKCIHLAIYSPEKSLHIAEFIDVIEGWFSVLKTQHENEIKEFQDLKKSGKLVSMSEWKRQT